MQNNTTGRIKARLLLLGLWRYWKLLLQLLASPFKDGRRPVATLLLILLWPLLLLWQLLHWAGFLLDEIFFRGYRSTPIVKPVFVLGPPRTGTTHLHRVLADCGNFTTFQTWECLFGLSVSGRKLCRLIGRLDRLLGRPLARTAGWLNRRLLSGMGDIHPLDLAAPEEDFLCLMPLAGCFLLSVPFPRARWLWRQAEFDRALSTQEKQALLDYYRACIQKHLYVHGTERPFLSKNPSFSGMAHGLLEAFPDARMLACLRDPLSAVPSQFSALRPILTWSGFGTNRHQWREQMLELLKFYYLNLADAADTSPDRVAFVMNTALHDDLSGTVSGALTATGLTVDAGMRACLERRAAASANFRSRHQYSLQEFGLDDELIHSRFAPVYERFGFDFARATGTD